MSEANREPLKYKAFIRLFLSLTPLGLHDKSAGKPVCTATSCPNGVCHKDVAYEKSFLTIFSQKCRQYFKGDSKIPEERYFGWFNKLYPEVVMISVGIVGGTGYTGVELLRLLANHPRATVKVISSRSEAGKAVSDVFPSLRQHYSLAFSEPNSAALKRCDVVFFATPHGVAMAQAPELLNAGVKVIDLGADFRIADAELWSQWYGLEHSATAVLSRAVYGLPEVNREAIRNARLIACPGCYPTAVQLAFMPLIKHGMIQLNNLIADCKSGVTGAGRGASLGTHFSEVNDSFKAYAASGHRHLPEIRQGLERVADEPVGLTFMPHLTPMLRGIHATCYGALQDATTSLESLHALFYETYRQEAFVDVLELGSHPETRSVKGSNYCRISLHKPQDGEVVVVLAVIDNLVKGASGQAIQNMNIAFGFDEATGLESPGLLP